MTIPAPDRRATWLVASALVLAAGCRSFVDNQAASSTYRILEKSITASGRQADVELARAALPGGIIQLDAFALAYPGHAEFRRLYADSLCQYTVAFVFDDWEDAQLGHRTDEQARLAARLTALLPQCVEANLAVLPPPWRAARAKGGDAWATMIARATTADARPLLWLATADAVALALDPLRNFGKLGAITAALERSAQLAPGAHDAAAELLLGTLTAARARFLPGSDGAALFQRARSLAGDGVLMVDVMFARGTAVARGDRALFEATLHRVLDADLARWPEHRLANELARIKARRYLAAAGELLPR
jgi:hypothetical protein